MAVRRPSTPYPIAVHIGGSLAAASCEPSNQNPMKSHFVTTQSYFIATLPATPSHPRRSRAGLHALKRLSGTSCLLSWELPSFCVNSCFQNLNLASQYECMYMYLDVHQYVCAYIYIYKDIWGSLRTGARPCPLAEQFVNLATKARRRASW